MARACASALFGTGGLAPSMGRLAPSVGAAIALSLLVFALVELYAPPLSDGQAAAAQRRPLPVALPGQQRPIADGSPPPPPPHTMLASAATTTSQAPQAKAAKGPQARQQPRVKASVHVDGTNVWLVGNGSRSSSVHDELADMDCAHDELYNNKGCQIRCKEQQGQVLPAGGQWSEAELALLQDPEPPPHHGKCPRAFAMCASLPHCLAVKSKKGVWGTLKASRGHAAGSLT